MHQTACSKPIEMRIVKQGECLRLHLHQVTEQELYDDGHLDWLNRRVECRIARRDRAASLRASTMTSLHVQWRPHLEESPTKPKPPRKVVQPAGPYLITHISQRVGMR